MKKHLYISCLVFLVCIQLTTFAQIPAVYQVEMRDGIHLATDVCLPDTGEGPWPAVLARTPYGRNRPSGIGSTQLMGDRKSSLLQRGIGIVIQDTRGRHDSEGEALFGASDGWGEQQDGYDTVAWIQKQKWCNGKIVTMGASAGGMTQVLLAGAEPKGIAGQLIHSAPVSFYHHSHYTGGVFRKQFIEEWLNWNKFPFESHITQVRSHPYYDEFWQTMNLSERADRVNWPVVILGCWYDLYIQGQIDLYTEIRKRGGPDARDNVFMLIGPYDHMNFDFWQNRSIGQFTYSEEANIPQNLWPDDMKWVEHWLLDNTLEPKPPRVLYYVMGEMPAGNAPGNEWRIADDWPPPAKLTRWFLTGDKALETKTPKQKTEFKYAYDPENPVPTLGGANIFGKSGPHDQRDIEDRDDVLLFNSEVLTEPIEVTGQLTAVLYVSTNAKDTDFTAKLSDVYPDGRSMLVCDSIRRLSLREEFSQPKEVVPGERYRLEIDLGSTSIVFNRGHRIRLAVSSSNSPRFEPNPNTGSPDWINKEKVIAEQTVYIGGDEASHLLLPIVAASKDRSRLGDDPGTGVTTTDSTRK